MTSPVRHRELPAVAQWVLAAAIVLLTCVFIVLRAASWPAEKFDITVWVRVHELMSRGGTLYRDVWDHKDPGFFFMSQWAYRLDDIRGLYTVGALCVLVFGLGAYFLVRLRLDRFSAVLLACAGVALYVSAPSFLAPYTECAIAFAVLGVGLLVSDRPALAGIALGTSAFIKVSGAGLFVAIFVAMVILDLLQRHAKTAKPLSVRLALGFLTTTALAAVALKLGGVLAGWQDVISYNAEYARIQGSVPLGLENLTALARAGWQNPALLITSVAAAAGLTALVVRDLRQRSSVRKESRGAGLVELLLARRDVVLSAALVVGACIALLPQSLYVQHLQYVMGASVALLICVLACFLEGVARPQAAALAIFGAVGVWSLILVTVLGANAYSYSLTQAPKAWTQLNDVGANDARLGLVSPDAKSLMVVATNEFDLDLRQLPAGVQVSCRFVYQLPHLMPRYGDEIRACAARKPDLIYWQRGTFLESDPALNRVRASYVVCDDGVVFTLYATEESLCRVQ